jgi:outer membrane biosynthesis protein TonB
MARLSASLLALSLAAVAALGFAACGSGDSPDLLPGDTASEITANLDQVERLANEEDCAGAAEAAESVSVQIEELAGVDPELKQALREGATRLNEVVAGCEEPAVEEETAPAIDEAEEPEEQEKEGKEKPEKASKPKPDEEPEETTAPALPPQAEGKAKGQAEPEEEVPPVESDTPSGGVGPAEPAGSE